MIRGCPVPITTRKPPVTLPRRPYATDLTDAEWQLLGPLIPAPKPGPPNGGPHGYDGAKKVNGPKRHSSLVWRITGVRCCVAL
jgi:hypothetical protein